MSASRLEGVNGVGPQSRRLVLVERRDLGVEDVVEDAVHDDGHRHPAVLALEAQREAVDSRDVAVVDGGLVEAGVRHEQSPVRRSRR